MVNFDLPKQPEGPPLLDKAVSPAKPSQAPATTEPTDNSFTGNRQSPSKKSQNA